MLNQFAVEIPTLPVDQCLHTTSNTRRIVETFLRIAATHLWAAKHLGHTWYIGKRFCTSTSFLFSSVSSRIKFYLEENY